MMGGTLFFYFMRRYAVLTAQIFLGLLIIAYLADFTEFSRRASSWDGFSFSAGLLLSLLKVPFIVQTAIPFIILFSAITALVNFNRKHELVIARAAGVSAWQFLAPLCVASFLIGVAAVAVLNPLAAKAFAYSQEMEATIRGANPGDDDGSRMPWLRQRTDEGVTIIGAKNTARRGLLLSQATFLRIGEDGDIVERLDARRAVLDDGAWRLTDVVRVDAARDKQELSTVSIKSGLSPEFVEQQLARPEAIPFFELPGKIEVARAFGLGADAFAMQFQSLLALPVLLVAMTLIAATVSMRFARMGQSATLILAGILAGFLLYVVSVVVKAFGSGGIVPPVVAAWTPVVVAMFFGVTFLLYKEDG